MEALCSSVAFTRMCKRCGVCLVVESGGGSEGAVGVDGVNGEQVVVLRAVAVGEGQGDRCVGVGVGGVQISDDGTCI